MLSPFSAQNSGGDSPKKLSQRDLPQIDSSAKNPLYYKKKSKVSEFSFDNKKEKKKKKHKKKHKKHKVKKNKNHHNKKKK